MSASVRPTVNRIYTRILRLVGEERALRVAHSRQADGEWWSCEWNGGHCHSSRHPAALVARVRIEVGK